MEMKNKLQKHHKSKMSICFKKIGVCFGFAVGIISAVSLPTYISIRSTPEITQKEEHKIDINEKVVEVSKEKIDFIKIPILIKK